MDINFSNQMPIYVQIMNLIKLDIVTKKLRGGDKLLSVREMSENLKVNPNTIQRAYQELEREGITYTQRGMGTFVNDDNDMIRRLKNEMASETINSFINGMKSLGFDGKEIINIITKRVKEEGI